MDFLYRLKYYLLGFGLGCVVVWATLYRGRDRTSWLPKGRIVSFLKETKVGFTEKSKCQMECIGLSEDFMDDVFWLDAGVDLGKSDTHRKPCPEYYIISKTAQNQELLVYIETCEKEEHATLKSVEVTSKEKGHTCDC